MVKSNIKNNFGLVILAIAMIMPYLKYYFKFSNYFDFIYLIYFIYIISLKSDTRQPVIGALILLAVCPYLLYNQRANFAESTAIGAYFLLVTGVGAQLTEFMRKKSSL